MIVTRKKPVEQVLVMLHGVRRVALVGCGNCATACQTGGEKELDQMRQLLQEQGIETVGSVLPDECCHMLLVKRDLKPLRDSGAEAVSYTHLMPESQPASTGGQNRKSHCATMP